MDWSVVWKAAIALGGLALLFGILLAFASRRFRVETDPRLNDLIDALLGSNCGACGYPGCEAAAQAVLDGKAGVDVCVAGGRKVAENVARVMGVEPTMAERGVALVHCIGGLEESVPKAIYQGIDSCVAADKIAGGPKACEYGCLGLGTCMAACPVNAIALDQEHRRWVNRDRCTGCGLCVEACPRHLIQVVPRGQEVLVVCNNRDKGARARQVCSVCCTACKKCEKVCEAGAISIADNRAWIDYDKCTQCGRCIEECPNQCIVRVAPRKRRRRRDLVTAGSSGGETGT
ncbi:MAG: RnfABCDGE type electron transport complex subunit B [Actinomycetota bacterium]